MKIKFAIGLLFLLLQIVSVIYSKTIPEKFFCWAPYDQHTNYETFVLLNNKELTSEEIKKRYHYKSQGWEPRSIYNYFNMISQYESTYGKNDIVTVKIKYSINGHKEQLWVLKR